MSEKVYNRDDEWVARIAAESAAPNSPTPTPPTDGMPAVLAEQARELLMGDEELQRAAADRMAEVSSEAIAGAFLLTLELNQALAARVLMRNPQPMASAIGEAIAAEARAIAVEHAPRLMAAVRSALGQPADPQVVASDSPTALHHWRSEAEASRRAIDDLSKKVDEESERNRYLRHLAKQWHEALVAERAAHGYTRIDRDSTEEDRQSVIHEREESRAALAKAEEALQQSERDLRQEIERADKAEEENARLKQAADELAVIAHATEKETHDAQAALGRAVVAMAIALDFYDAAGGSTDEIDANAEEMRAILADPTSAAAGEAFHVLVEVQAERRRQDEQWGGAEHDDEHHRGDWLGYLDKQWHAANEDTTVAGDAWRNSLVKIAALAIAAVESHDRGAPRRGQ